MPMPVSTHTDRPVHDQGNSPAPEGRRERKRNQTHEKLLGCALRLFGERGFANTKVEDITEAADVGKGTFFNYFPSKEHVLMHVAEIQRGKYQNAIVAVQQPGSNVYEVIRALYFDLPKLPLSSPGLLRSLLTVFVTDGELRSRVSEGFSRGRMALNHIIQVGQQRGQIRRDREAEELSLAFQRSLMGTAFMWTLHDTTEHDWWLHSGWDLFWSSICVEAEGLGPEKMPHRKPARRK
jgi:AcrR family transcriptional regulator